MNSQEKVLFCRVGWMNSYEGPTADDQTQNGGKYNENHDGHESFNYKSHSGTYYGYVESGYNHDKTNPDLFHRHSIHIENFGVSKKDQFVDGLTIVWVAKPPKGNGQYIVGWYKNARLYRDLQIVPDVIKSERNHEELVDYNIVSRDVFLLNPDERNFQIPQGKGGIGQCQYCNTVKQVDIICNRNYPGRQIIAA